MTISIKEKSYKSAVWLFGRHVVTNFIQIGAIAVLARQLSPSDFGIVALAQIVLRFLTTVGSSGVGHFVIYDREEGRESRLSAAFWLNLFLSFGVAILCMIAVPFVGKFYAYPLLDKILFVLIGRYLFEQIGVVPDAIIRRSIEFKKLVVRDTALGMFSSIGSIGMALSGWGVWSLVVPSCAAAVIRLPFTFRLACWIPIFSLRISEWHRIISYSARVLGNEIVNTIVTEGDTLLIGKILGNHMLGVYNMAWRAANLVKRNVAGVAGKIAMPALSALNDGSGRISDGFKKMLNMLGIVNFPLLIGLFVLADDFVLGVYGQQWKEAILPLRIIIIFALRNVVGSPISVLFNVVGRPGAALKVNLIQVPFYLGGIWFGSYYGIVGVAVAVTVVRTVFGFVSMKIAAGFINETLKSTLGYLSQSFIAALIMGSAVFTLKIFIGAFYLVGPVTNLLILVPFGGFVYLIVLRIYCRDATMDIIEIVGSVSPPLRLKLKRIFGVPIL